MADKIHSMFVNTMKTMYMLKKIDITKLQSLRNNRKISSEEYEYIVRREE